MYVLSSIKTLLFPCLFVVSGCMSSPNTSFKKSIRFKNGLFYGNIKKPIWPTSGRLSSFFGKRWGRKHEGIDISGKIGTPIYATQKGKVIFSGSKRGYGKTIIILHDGYRTQYAHCKKIIAEKNREVVKGERIALMGSSGRSLDPHLHFEYQSLEGVPRDPLLLLPPLKLLSQP